MITPKINKDNRYKIVFLFLLIFFSSGLVHSQTQPGVSNRLHKYVYLYELPNTSPEQVLLEVQSDLAWHSIILTKKGSRYFFQGFWR
jgi:hypothetical protein